MLEPIPGLSSVKRHQRPCTAGGTKARRCRPRGLTEGGHGGAGSSDGFCETLLSLNFQTKVLSFDRLLHQRAANRCGSDAARRDVDPDLKSESTNVRSSFFRFCGGGEASDSARDAFVEIGELASNPLARIYHIDGAVNASAQFDRGQRFLPPHPAFRPPYCGGHVAGKGLLEK